MSLLAAATKRTVRDGRMRREFRSRSPTSERMPHVLENHVHVVVRVAVLHALAEKEDDVQKGEHVHKVDDSGRKEAESLCERAGARFV